jgi:hypothetical protein|tara:strand:- start:3999 stop:4367 length:369 start_codon:yes stop_codon:yes gene_type:complete
MAYLGITPAPIAENYEGLSRAWINFDAEATGAVADYDRDSFNISVTVDNGTGNHTLGFVSNMENANYCVVSGGHTTNTISFAAQHTQVAGLTTSTFRNLCNNSSGNANDWTLSTAVVHGDLA